MSKKILIVDDDKDILDALQELLEGEGYLTEIAKNGMVALEVLGKMGALPDLILLDYMMPEMDAPAFRSAQGLDPRISSIPILLMTADDHIDAKQVQLGARGCIKKPVKLDAFLALVVECLK